MRVKAKPMAGLQQQARHLHAGIKVSGKGAALTRTRSGALRAIEEHPLCGRPGEHRHLDVYGPTLPLEFVNGSAYAFNFATGRMLHGDDQRSRSDCVSCDQPTFEHLVCIAQ